MAVRSRFYGSVLYSYFKSVCDHFSHKIFCIHYQAL